jgi:hypothetical protein
MLASPFSCFWWGTVELKKTNNNPKQQNNEEENATAGPWAPSLAERPHNRPPSRADGGEKRGTERQPRNQRKAPGKNSARGRNTRTSGLPKKKGVGGGGVASWPQSQLGSKRAAANRRSEDVQQHEERTINSNTKFRLTSVQNTGGTWMCRTPSAETPATRRLPAHGAIRP